ncbi:MAG: DUF134 domain-containing protein [Proteiniphilum sp.]|nr:DUF134 domain-containing protein [Proteiniphilum sp.]
MPNRTRDRKIMMPPLMDGYKPFGIATRELKWITLHFEEFEAIRLVDYERLHQEEAAEIMNISRPTFTRLLDKARRKMARAFVEGKGILIKGGTYVTEHYWYKCHNCNETMITMKPASQCRGCESEDLIQLSGDHK